MSAKQAGKGSDIRDVARLAGVAPSTVSRVLNDTGTGVRISAATVERVRHAAHELRYIPNAAARSLRTTRAHTIGVIARDLLHPFTAELLRIIYSTCQARDYHLLVGHVERNKMEGRVLSDILCADRVDGVLLIGDTGADNMERLIQMHTHVVAVGARPSHAGELSILVDDAHAVTLALEHLVSLGHRSIGYLRRTPPAAAVAQWEDYQRQTVYRTFLRAAGLPYTPEADLVVPDQIEKIQEALHALLSLPHHPTALFVNEDMTAIITIKAALTSGIRVPEDLSIVSIDDIPFAALCTPGLTTVRQPLEAMGHYAATYLLDGINGIETPPPAPDTAELRDTHTVFFSPTLVRRESAGHITRSAPGTATF